MAVVVVEAEGVVEEGGELIGLPRYGLGGGFLALVGVAEGLDGLGDLVFVGGLYGGQALEEVADLSRLEGRLPRRAESLVREWAVPHRLELEENWQKAREGKPLDRIPGLE